MGPLLVIWEMDLTLLRYLKGAIVFLGVIGGGVCVSAFSAERWFHETSMWHTRNLLEIDATLDHKLEAPS